MAARTLEFANGFRDKDTVENVYENLEFQDGVQAFLTAMPGTLLSAVRKGSRSFGLENQTVIIFETLLDSKSVFLTPTRRPST